MRTREVFEKLGFEEVWGSITDQEPAYKYDFGNIELTAVQVTSMYFRPIFLLTGIASDKRSIREIDQQMPLEVESFEQGVAIIAYALGECHTTKQIPWVERGRQWEEHLPWVQEIRKYENRPQCSVDREWFRIAAKKLRELAKHAKPGEMVAFEFDGEVLRIKTSGELFAMPAQGAGWDQKYQLQFSKLIFLPKRIMRDPVSFGVWEGNLTIDNRRFQLMLFPVSDQNTP